MSHPDRIASIRQLESIYGFPKGGAAAKPAFPSNRPC